MRVNYKHVIQETPSELKKLQTQQKALSRFRKMQGLYLLKTGEVKTVTHLADYLGVHRVTIQKWLKSYRQEGVRGLLREPEDQGGRPKQLEDSAIAHLQERLSQEEQGFRSYGEIQKWLKDNYQIFLNYKTLYHLVKYKLKAKLKVPRRSAARKNEEEAEGFKKKLPLLLKTVEWLEKMERKENRKIRYWCQDETRLGLKTIERKRITAHGVKPIGKVQWEFVAYYLYGIIEPSSGDNFFLEFSHLDSDCFQIFLEQVSEYSPNYLNVIQLDQGKFHQSKDLKIPENIVLIFQPAPSPELNPIERFWQYIKEELSWKIYEELEELKEEVRTILTKITPKTITSLTNWNYLQKALTVV